MLLRVFALSDEEQAIWGEVADVTDHPILKGISFNQGMGLFHGTVH